jgi:heterotetrameric sarcosine oxidase gamma subunit
MPELHLTPALEGTAPVVLGDLTVRVLPQKQLFELRGSSAMLAARYPGLLPIQPNRSNAHDGWRAIWLRPNGWLLSRSAPVGGGAWSEVLHAQLAGLCRITDVSHSRVCIALEGSGARVLLGKGTPLDLRPGRFAPGQCARTLCAVFSVLLDHTESGIDVYVDVPLASAFWEWLNDAALELSQ